MNAVMENTKKYINIEQPFCKSTECPNCMYYNRCILPKSGKHKNLDILNLDLFKESWVDKINKSSKSEILEDREFLKSEFEKLNNIIKDPNVGNGIKKFLKAKRHIVESTLSYIRRRLGVINKVINKSTNKNFSKKFIEVAEEELPHNLFQKILGKSIQEEKISELSISIIGSIKTRKGR